MIKNYMEEIVVKYLEQILLKYENICKCDECKDDMVALALNHLEPLYVTSTEGSAYAKLKALESQHKVDIIAELTNAVGKVSSNAHNHKNL